MNNRIILGLDLDGVLYDYHSALYTYCQYELNYLGTYEEFWLNYMKNSNNERQNYLTSLPIPYEMIVPSKCVTDFLEFANSNSDIYYITHRPQHLERITRRYFRRYNFPQQDNLFMTDDKITCCRYLGITHFIDDFVNNVKAVSAVADSYLMAKPWNKEFQDDFKTVHNLNEFREAVFIQ